MHIDIAEYEAKTKRSDNLINELTEKVNGLSNIVRDKDSLIRKLENGLLHAGQKDKGLISIFSWWSIELPPFSAPRQKMRISCCSSTGQTKRYFTGSRWKERSSRRCLSCFRL